jgi:hypothetical protein
MNLINKIRVQSILLFLVLLPFTGCLKKDKLDGLTDTRPAISVTFPGRQYIQDAGLAFVTPGYASNPNVSVIMELEGGEGRTIARLKTVEARAIQVNAIQITPQLTAPARTCPSYAVFASNVAANNQRQFTYITPLPTLLASAATCNADMRRPNVIYEFIFTVVLDNGTELVSMPVRSIITQ